MVFSILNFILLVGLSIYVIRLSGWLNDWVEWFYKSNQSMKDQIFDLKNKNKF